MIFPKDDDLITNADESKKLPEENPEPLTETKKDEPDLKTEPENPVPETDKPATDG